MWLRIQQTFADGQVFTTAEAAEAIRGVVNPMVAARACMNNRVSDSDWRSRTRPERTPRHDAVTVGLVALAGKALVNNVCYGSLERVAPGQFRFVRRAD